MWWLAALMVLFFGAPLAAQDIYPDHFFVTDVAADDVLNIRAAPDANAAIKGSYAPDAINIEVLKTSPDGAWGFVGLGEGNGWVAMRYLQRSDHTPVGELPRPMNCFGTEPFWALRLTPRGDEYQMMGEDLRILELTDFATAPDGYFAQFKEGPTLDRTLIVKRLSCGDGMSDRVFGFQATLFNRTPDWNGVQTGCCSLDN